MAKKRVSSKKSEKLSELSERIYIKDNGVSFVSAVIALSIVRNLSVDAFVVDKCNESLQHWESLQKQLLATWIYSFQFEPGSYLYFLFRKLVGSPDFSLVIWLENEKLGLLYGARLFLGILSVLTEATLVVALSRKYGRHHGLYTLAMLSLSRGCFFASTSFLPSTFSMFALSLSSAFYLLDMPTMALAVAAIGTTLGWPFLVLTFLPIIVHTLIRNQDHAFLRGLIVTFFVTVLSIRFNHQFHRMWTSSIEDLLFYNVVEGGVDSSYGIEGLLYYLKNGFALFNYAYVFAWLFLVILPIVKSKYVPDMLVVVSPIYILTAYMSLLPHKEERFLYSIYPLVCVAASTVINSLPDLVRHKFTLNDNSLLVMIAKFARPCILGVILFSSYFHRSQLTNGYSALEICKQMGH